MKIQFKKTKDGLEITLRGKKEFKQKYPNLYPEPFELLDEAGLIGNNWDDGTDRCSFALTSSPIFLKGGEIYCLDNNYFNIETQKLYCSSYDSMATDKFLFLNNRFDKDVTKRGVMKINKTDGTFELFPE